MSQYQGMDFGQILRETEEAVRNTAGAFALSEVGRYRLTVINAEVLLGRPLNNIEIKMLKTIMDVDAYSWDRGVNGGLISGIGSFDDVFEGGAQPGLILFGAAPNVGKSAFMLQVCKGISERNDNVYVSYHSLDDSSNDLVPRYIANDQRITIGQAKTPAKFETDATIMEKRNAGVQNMATRIDRFGIFDSNHFTSVEEIENHIKDILMSYGEGIRIVIAIDSFNDLTVESKNFNNNDDKNAYIAKLIKSWSTRFNAVVMCTTHLRKTNGKRPTEDDLKDTITLRYEATLVCLMHNEVGIKQEGAEVFWLDEDEEKKMPVVEVNYAKNKHSSIKTVRFYEFIPDYSLFMDSTPESNRRYAALIYN